MTKQGCKIAIITEPPSYGFDFLKKIKSPVSREDKIKAKKLYTKGFEYEVKCQLLEAAKSYRKAQELCPKIKEYGLAWQLCLFHHRYIEEAKKHLQMGAASKLHNAYGNHLMATGYIQTKKYDKAETHFIQAIKLAPTNSVYLWDYAEFLNKIHRLKKAMHYYRKSIKYRPNYVRNIYDFSLILMGIKHYTEAIKYLSAAHTLSPRNHNIIYSLGVCFKKKGNIRDAEKYFRLGIKINPDSIMGWSELIEILLETGRTEEAKICQDQYDKMCEDIEDVY